MRKRMAAKCLKQNLKRSWHQLWQDYEWSITSIAIFKAITEVTGSSNVEGDEKVKKKKNMAKDKAARLELSVSKQIVTAARSKCS